LEASGTLCLGFLDWQRHGRIARCVVVIMSTAKHAPGPWAVIPKKTPKGDIATVYNTPDGWVSIHAPTWLNIGDQQVAMENARLMAAAPDLLAALRELVSQVQGYQDCNGDKGFVVTDAIAAIAKATGETA